MNAHPVFVIVVVLFIAHSTAPAADRKQSWTGELVLHIKHPKDVSFRERVDGKVVHLPFSGRGPITVHSERDGRLRIHDGHRKGWVDKDDFVLLVDALAYFQRRVQANPKDAFARHMRGEVRLANGKPDDALGDFNACIRMDPTDWTH